MLYNTELEQAAEAKNEMSLGSLIAWLEKQPKGKVYTYVNPYNCLICQYLKAQGHTSVYVDDRGYTISGNFGLMTPLPKGWDAIAKGPHWAQTHTFGDALNRARELQTA